MAQTAVASTQQLPPRTIAVVINDQPQPPGFFEHSGTAEDYANANAGLYSALAAKLAAAGLVQVPLEQSPELLINCVVTDARSGSEARRLLLGFGAGRARLKVSVTLVDMRTGSQSLLWFQTESTTGAMPGAGLGLASGIASGNALGIAGGAAGIPGTLRQGLPKEEQQAADDIADRIGRYFKQRSWPYAATS